MNLKERRASAGLTQDAVASALNIQRTTVSMWESGKSSPTADRLPALAKLYGCTIDDLFDQKQPDRPA